MRAFILHDGEDDARTNELHKFMEPITSGTPHDWDGHDSGISIVLQVSVGDAIVLGADDSIRVLPKGQPVRISENTFPMVYRAMLMIEHDNGAHHVNRIAGPGTVELSFFEMPFEYGVDRLCEAEQALCELDEVDTDVTSDAFEDLCVGSQEDQEQLIADLGDEIPDLRTAHDLLNAWFNGWEKTDGK